MTPGFLPVAYVYMNGFILAIGLWSLISPESVDAMMMVNILLHLSSKLNAFLKCRK